MNREVTFQRRQSGLTLVELMVAMTIGLMLTLAVTSLLITSESNRRVTTSTNDADQTGAYGFYALDRVMRGAGSAIADSVYPNDRAVLGCHLNAGAILPRSTAFPTPFTNVLTGNTSKLVLAPLLIAKGASTGGSDVLIVMSGSGAAGGVPRQVTAAGSSNTLNLDNTVGFNPNDLVLVTQPAGPGISASPDCLMEQVSAVNTNSLTLGGTYYTTTAATTNISALSSSTGSYVTAVGNTAANNVQFMMFGAGTDYVLYSYDLLQLNGTVSQAMSDGVYGMYAVYGVDTTGDAIQDTWVDPSGSYDISTVMANTDTMRKILSVHVALIVKSNTYEGHTTDDPTKLTTPATLTYFNGLTDSSGNALTALSHTLTLTSDQRHYRWRVFEFTVPLRNMLILAQVAGT